MIKYVVAAIFLCCVSAPASANLGGGNLKKYCEDKDSPSSQMYCIAYIQATVDSFRLSDDVMTRAKLGKVFACVPEGVPEQVLEVVVERYLADHSDKLQFGASSLIGDALNRAYPCREKSN